MTTGIEGKRRHRAPASPSSHLAFFGIAVYAVEIVPDARSGKTLPTLFKM